jgi:hypothetical protein
MLVDPGAYCSTSESVWRDFFRGTAAHSTVMINGRDQIEPSGPFSGRGRLSVHVREWRSNDECDFIDASHSAYPGLRHRRRVMFVKPTYWVIVDDLEFTKSVKRGSDPLSIDLNFQFAPLSVSLVRERWAQAVTPAGNTCWVGSFSPAPMKAQVKIGELAPIRGWVSADYGQRTAAPLLIFSANALLPWRSITLVIPERGDRSSTPSAEPLFDDQNLPIGVALDDLRESVFVDESDIFRSRDL